MPTNRLELPDDDRALLGDVSGLIEAARTRAAVAVNSALVMLYWSIGKRIREDVLGGERAEYGQAVVKRLAERLTERYGRGYSRSNLLRKVQFAEVWPDEAIVAPVARQLTRTSICIALGLPDQRRREFYLTFAAHERLEDGEIRAARYITEPIREKMQRRLRETIDALGVESA